MREWIGTLTLTSLAFTGGIMAGHYAPASAAFENGRQSVLESAQHEAPTAHMQLFSVGFKLGERTAGKDIFAGCLAVLAEDEHEAGEGEGWCDAILDAAEDIASAREGAR